MKNKLKIKEEGDLYKSNEKKKKGNSYHRSLYMIIIDSNDNKIVLNKCEMSNFINTNTDKFHQLIPKAEEAVGKVESLYPSNPGNNPSEKIVKPVKACRRNSAGDVNFDYLLKADLLV